MCGSRLHDADEDGTLNVTKKLKRILPARKQRSKSYRTLTEEGLQRGKRILS